MPRLLVITRIWPTRDRPAAGAFVADRVRGLSRPAVVAPRGYDLPWWTVYLVLLRDALRVRGRFDGVEAHTLIPAGPVALIVATLRRVPLVVYAHGGDVRGYPERGPVGRWLMRTVATRAAAVVTNSRDTAARLTAIGRRRDAVVAPPGVDRSRFRPSARPGERRILYLGGLSERKGYEVAVRFADTLVGPGLREVAHDDVPVLMAQHDVVLVPSVEEPYGMVAAEAIASGRWVLARAVGGLTEIVEDGVNGTLVTDGDFAGALERVPDYDPFAVARTAERFDLAAWHARLDAVWSDVLRASGSARRRRRIL
jgi:glycosyltransferase involved in cell wall biosynthesis